MLKLIARRLLQMILIMVVVSLVLFVIFDSDKFKKQIATAELGGFSVAAMSDHDYQKWLKSKGLDVPVYERYAQWVGGLLQGDFGKSFEKNAPVSQVMGERLVNTGILAFWVFFLMIPLSLVFGIVAGMKEGSLQDRSVSFIAVFTTSIPEIATAILLTVIIALGLGWLPAKSAMTGGWNSAELILPVLTLVLYDFGYVARMTRASMAEVMTSQYIRTAVLKGIPYARVIMRHALRNALIAPFTVIVLQLNWLLSGVVVVEVFFQFNGFGKMLLEAALFGDVYVIQAATLVAVFVAVLSQIISDVGYTFLNPRIRFS
ncbi:MAG: ABC transporter permease [Rhodospirillaceae bacterium]|nr:ABC transporter permease [Rhodospirillaceae bacterium]MDE0255426.1 ABC transporter permease [Rhodospirillaceae bacterium]MDE0619928.1 ABC transporter permease [Rhodospirillaceae bacterium]MXY38918.1 ABC transporter permease [Rhodospirillaceae bacterium]MYK14766.1 ABC transporter permease [Rhodospirillaceae bacterium]